MLVFLQMSMDLLKHYVFLFGASGPGKPMNMSNKVMTSPQREPPEDRQMEQATHKMPYYVKNSIFTWGQIKALSTKDENVYGPLEASLLQRIFFWPWLLSLPVHLW
jgi:hypothetical protein